jgi:hypothetical protein
MARKLRVEYPGAIYHVMNRGDRHEPILIVTFNKRPWKTAVRRFCIDHEPYNVFHGNTLLRSDPDLTSICRFDLDLPNAWPASWQLNPRQCDVRETGRWVPA